MKVKQMFLTNKKGLVTSRPALIRILLRVHDRGKMIPDGNTEMQKRLKPSRMGEYK